MKKRPKTELTKKACPNTAFKTVAKRNSSLQMQEHKGKVQKFYHQILAF
jgi:hypothetical protein